MNAEPTRMFNRTEKPAIEIICFASPGYWSDPQQLKRAFSKILESITQALSEVPLIPFVHLIQNEQDVVAHRSHSSGPFAVFLPMSGAVQNWMVELAANYTSLAVLNAYLETIEMPLEIRNLLLQKNAHPAGTDFFSFLKLKHQQAFWLFSLEDLNQICNSWQAINRLKSSRILQIGETEPWVVNSCRDPNQFKEKLGLDVLKISLRQLYAYIARVKASDLEEIDEFKSLAPERRHGIDQTDITAAGKIYSGLKQLLAEYQADGLAIACFSLIKELNTTSCLALSLLNSSKYYIAACEGDLDAAVTLSLIKSLTNNLVWMGNPIIHQRDFIDLVHCTCAIQAGAAKLKYSFLRHHESGLGVSLRVSLLLKEQVTLARIGNNLEDLLICSGQTVEAPDLPTCRTQLRISIPSSKNLVRHLMGTHLICGFGDLQQELEYCGQFLNLNIRIG